MGSPACLGEWDLIDLLKNKGVFDNTLILFASDNGYSHGGKESLDEFFRHSGPFKGEKGNLHQGGVRVPALAHWSGHIPAGTVCNEPWGLFDLLPTFCEITGESAPEDIDGNSVEHEQTLYNPDPGESIASWRQRLQEAEVKLPNNVND